MKIVILLLMTTLVWSKECDFPFLPMPNSCQVSTANSAKDIDPCNILYTIKVDVDTQHFQEVVTHYHKKSYFCTQANIVFDQQMEVDITDPYRVTVNVKDTKLRSVFSKQQEKYSIHVDKDNATLTADTYVGFIRALETFHQTISCNQTGEQLKCKLTHLPIKVNDDYPVYSYRGLMIDTSRHYLPFHLILETIDAMMYNKMSVLHWHITDEDSFPLILDSHPEIAQYGAYSEDETYTAAQAREVVRYAMVRGVRVIPELDTPGHAASWGKAPQNKDIACTFGYGYMGPLDVTMQATYKVLTDVLREIDDIFPDPVVHFGGDEVSLTCLKNSTQARKDMDRYNVGGNFQLYYRKRQRKIMREINPEKKAMYWMNSDVSTIEKDDVVHWWGQGIPNTQNNIVISNYGSYYLDMGVGNYLGVGYGSYVNWMDIYGHNIHSESRASPNKDSIIGAEVCLWSEISNQYTHHIKIWMRTSSLAERLWNPEINNIKPGLLGRLAKKERVMHRRGIPTQPVTCQICQANPSWC